MTPNHWNYEQQANEARHRRDTMSTQPSERAMRAATRIASALEGIVEGWTEDFARIIDSEIHPPADDGRKELVELLERALRRIDFLNTGGPKEPDPTAIAIRKALAKHSL